MASGGQGGALGSPTARVRLVYAREAGAERCPDDLTLRTAVLHRLGYDPFDVEADTTISVLVLRAGPSLRARIQLADARGDVAGTRQLASRRLDCADLGRTLELDIAMIIDPERAARPPPSSTPAAPPPPSPPPTVASARPPSPATPPPPLRPLPPEPSPLDQPVAPRTPLHARFAVGSLLLLGAAPDVTVGLLVAVGLSRSWLSLDLELRGDLPASGSAPPGRATTSRLLGELVPCGHLWRAHACAVVGGGVQLAAGSGYPVDRDVVAPLVTAGARLGVDLPLSGALAVGLDGELLFDLVRNDLEVASKIVYRAPLSSGGVGVRLLLTAW